MATVHQRIEFLCAENKTTPPNQRHSINIGRMISTHFKRFWALDQPAEVLAEAKFVAEEVRRHTIVVVDYPASFTPEMDKIVSDYMVDLVKRRLIAEEKIRKELARKKEASAE